MASVRLDRTLSSLALFFRLQTHVIIDKEQFYVTPNGFCSLASIFHDSTVCKHFLLLNVRWKLALSLF
jgi:hypothetical protein